MKTSQHYVLRVIRRYHEYLSTCSMKENGFQINAMTSALSCIPPDFAGLEYEKDVHTEHCCFEHGCKYGDEDCTVIKGFKPQSYLCEDCVE